MIQFVESKDNWIQHRIRMNGGINTSSGHEDEGMLGTRGKNGADKGRRNRGLG